jgi:hypothetical protein
MKNQAEVESALKKALDKIRYEPRQVRYLSGAFCVSRIRQLLKVINSGKQIHSFPKFSTAFVAEAELS